MTETADLLDRTADHLDYTADRRRAHLERLAETTATAGGAHLLADQLDGLAMTWRARRPADPERAADWREQVDALGSALLPTWSTSAGDRLRWREACGDRWHNAGHLGNRGRAAWLPDPRREAGRLTAADLDRLADVVASRTVPTLDRSRVLAYAARHLERRPAKPTGPDAAAWRRLAFVRLRAILPDRGTSAERLAWADLVGGRYTGATWRPDPRD